MELLPCLKIIYLLNLEEAISTVCYKEPLVRSVVVRDVASIPLTFLKTKHSRKAVVFTDDDLLTMLLVTALICICFTLHLV